MKGQSVTRPEVEVQPDELILVAGQVTRELNSRDFVMRIPDGSCTCVAWSVAGSPLRPEPLLLLPEPCILDSRLAV